MKNRGFTLIEMMITVAIVAILAAIAYPSYRNYVLRAHRAEGKSALLQLQVAQEKYFLQNNRYAIKAGSTNELTPAPSSGGLGIASTTENGYYTINLTNSTATTYTATATATGGQAEDTNCTILSLTHEGKQESKNSSSTASTGCWK